MVIKPGYMGMVEGDWFEWMYPQIDPVMEVAALTFNVGGECLILQDIHVFPVQGMPAPSQLDLLQYKNDFLLDMRLAGYAQVNIRGKRIKDGKCVRAVNLTFRA